MICPRCRCENIKRRVIRGETTYYCPNCGYSWHECKSTYGW